MNKKQRAKPAKQSRYISGIYNYCDRWCERCAFTSRCRNFTLTGRRFKDPASRDINNKLFWKKIGETFQEVIVMLEKEAKKRGIDLTDIDVEAAAAEERNRRERAGKHECAQDAKAYAEKVRVWFKAAKGLLREKEDELNAQARLGIPLPALKGKAVGIGDAIEIISFYQHQIWVKLMRALGSEEREAEFPADGFPRDADGSAKVALIGMDRSISAWGRLLKQFPEQEKEILAVLALLARLRKRTEAVFPAARTFIRPGLDQA
jgi:hypothetical protein